MTTTGKRRKTGAPRAALNLYSLLGTGLFVLALALQVSVGEERPSGIHRMTTDINRALMKVLDGIDDFNYTEHLPRDDYNSSTVFNSRGMAVLYNLTDLFIDAVIPEIVPDGNIEIVNGQVVVKDGDYLALAKHYMGYLIFVAVLLAFALLMPLCGFCVCCCRCCCHRCGGRTKPFDKKGDLCKKIVYATMLIAFGTLFLFGVVCAFVTNQHMQDGTDELVPNLKTGVSDANGFFEDTSVHAKLLLQDNFAQFRDVISQTLDNSSDVLYNDLMNITHAASMEEAKEISSSISPLQKKLTDIKVGTNSLRVQASQLNDATRKIKNDLQSVLQTCKEKIPACTNLMNDYVSKLGTEIDFNQIPDVSVFITNLDGLDDLDAQIDEGMENLEKVKTTIKDNVAVNIGTAKDAMREAGEKINKESDTILVMMADINKKLTGFSNKGLNTADRYLKEYSKYRYYVGLGVSCTLLIISICVALGLICGICGKRPDSYNDDCCNKGAGGRFLMCGVGIMFLTAFFLVVILLVHSVAMFAHLVICEPIRDPKGNEALAFIDSILRLDKVMGDGVTVESVLDKCYRNESAYSVFKLENKFDLDQIRIYVKEFGIEKLWEEFNEQIKDLKFTGTLLNEEAINTINKLKAIKFDEINFDKFEEELTHNFTTVDLEKFSRELEKVIEQVENTEGMGTIVGDLKLIKIHVDAYIEKLFKPMTVNAQKILENVISIKGLMNWQDFPAILDKLVANIKEAEDTLQTQGPEQLMKVTEQFSEKILNEVEAYVNRTIGKFENEVGKCGPLSLVIKGTMTSTCDKVLAPMNGFWFSIFWCLMLFIPTIVVSVKLASLYQKSDSLPGAYFESEYLYDAYADRENIPLARGKHGRKNKKKRSDRYPSETYNPGHREYPGGSHHHPDARYADMAPKHFEDYPNGGPPQYQRATEYERPPPYYFPGSSDQN